MKKMMMNRFEDEVRYGADEQENFETEVDENGVEKKAKKKPWYKISKESLLVAGGFLTGAIVTGGTMYALDARKSKRRNKKNDDNANNVVDSDFPKAVAESE